MESCLMDFVANISSSFKDSCRVIAVFGTPTFRQYNNMQHHWEIFLSLVSKKLSNLKGHREDGSETPAWNRCAMYRINKLLYVHFGIHHS